MICFSSAVSSKDTPLSCIHSAYPSTLPHYESDGFSPQCTKKGALIRFAEQEDVYLVEDNGELRLVDKDTVIFKNGLNIFQISPRRIYTINQRFENIRKGREVVGQVDWDPRVLSSQDLKNFLP